MYLINHGNVFLTVLGGGKSEVEMRADSVPGVNPFLVHRCHLLPVSSHDGRGREVPGVPIIRAGIPFLRAPPS